MGKKLKDLIGRISQLFNSKSEIILSSDLEKYYLGVNEVPMSRFKLLKENNDTTALRKDLSKGNDVDDQLAIDIFSENFFKFQGLSDEYEFLLELKHQLALLQVKYLTGKGRHYLNQIRTKEAQIQEQEDKLKGGMSITDAKTFIEEKMKQILDLNIITVEDFYSKLDYYGRKH